MCVLQAGRQRLGELEAALAAQTQHADAQAALALDLDEKLRAAKAKAEAVRLELTAQMEVRAGCSAISNKLGPISPCGCSALSTPHRSWGGSRGGGETWLR